MPERVHSCLMVIGFATLAGLSLTHASDAGGKPMPTSPAVVTEFRLPAGNFYPRSIAAGTDGNLWFANSKGQPDRSAFAQDYEPLIDRITVDGQITEFPLPRFGANSLARGPGGIWFVREGHVGRIAPGGEIIEFSVPTGPYPGDIVAGPDGNLWVTKRNDSTRDAILRITTSGHVSAFHLPTRESGPEAITAGPDGNLWFTEYFGSRIGRITPSGELTEFQIPRQPFGGITAGPDGNLWFTANGSIGRMTPSGQLTRFAVDQAFGSIVAGADGRLWFASGYGMLGRITPGGRLSRVELPFAASTVEDIAAGPDGNVWYTAMGDYPCMGGGGTCMTYLPDNPGIVGSVSPGSLTVEIYRGRASREARWGMVGLRCLGGRASSMCRGELSLSANGIEVAKQPYRLGADTTRAVAVRLNRKARGWLHRDRRLRAIASATLEGGELASREVTLRLRRR